MKVILFSHSHPLFSKGGGEFAAYYQYQGINATKNNEAWFVARAEDKQLHLGVPIAALNEKEFLISGNADVKDITTWLALDDKSDFVSMLKSIQPDVLHFHHYAFLGLELIRVAKRICPQARIVLTLHEYIAICMHNGQMIKTNGKLCYQYSPRECALCFSNQTPESFFLRERYIKSFFSLVDIFVSPSYFLRERYIAWGLPADKFRVIENGLPVEEKVPLRPLFGDGQRGRFAYFGQINPYKGLDIILDAFAILPQRIKKQISLDIFGAGLDRQTTEYKDKINARLEANKKIVHYHGPYEAHEIQRLMRDVDWVMMGSIWWENSPLVIQEAFKFGRPVICPDIGGMAEKVQDGVSGLHYRARDSLSLATLIESVIFNNELYEKLCAGLPKAPTIDDCVATHLELYNSIALQSIN